MTPTYRVLTYAADGMGWNLAGFHREESAALRHAAEERRAILLAAVVKVTPRTGDLPRLEVIAANCPRPERLLASDHFRSVALAL